MSVLTIVQAIVARCLYLLHNVTTVYYTAIALEDNIYLTLFILSVCIALETVYTVYKWGGVESQWFSSSTFFFLGATVPAIWLMEVDRLDVFVRNQLMNSSDLTNTSTKQFYPWKQAQAIQLPYVDISFTLPRETVLEVIKQTFLVIVIFARWLLPLGKISRHELSQLLFVYFAMASDIMELFQLYDDERVTRNKVVSYIILGAWSLSLVQFTLVLTMTRSVHRARPIRGLTVKRQRRDSKKEADDTENPDPSRGRSRESGASRGRPRGSGASRAIPSESRTKKGNGSETSEDDHINCCSLGCLSSDVWSLLVTLFSMDGPFLGVRMYIVVGLGIVEYNIIFFLIKNILVVGLSLYRLVVIFVFAHEATQEKAKLKAQAQRQDRGKTVYRYSVNESRNDKFTGQVISESNNQGVITLRNTSF